MKVSVSGRQFVFPRSCACCGAFPTTTLGVAGTEKNRRARTKGWTWDIPYCRACKRHVRSLEYLLLGTLAFVGISCFTGALLAIKSDQWEFGVAVTSLLLTTIALVDWLAFKLIRRSCPKNCYLTGRAVVYIGSDGACHTFDLKSPFYAADFVLANHLKIVNASVRVASILKNTKFGDYQVPRRFVKKD